MIGIIILIAIVIILLNGIFLGWKLIDDLEYDVLGIILLLICITTLAVGTMTLVAYRVNSHVLYNDYKAMEETLITARNVEKGLVALNPSQADRHSVLENAGLQDRIITINQALLNAQYWNNNFFLDYWWSDKINKLPLLK